MVHGMINGQGLCIGIRDDIAEKKNEYSCLHVFQ